jgi:hypothetical protein
MNLPRNVKKLENIWNLRWVYQFLTKSLEIRTMRLIQISDINITNLEILSEILKQLTIFGNISS